MMNEHNIQKNFIIYKLNEIMDDYEINLDDAIDFLMDRFLYFYMFESLTILLEIQHEVRTLRENIVSLFFINMYKYRL